MDDRNFDDWIKRKLDYYEDSSFDPAAMAAFQQQMAGYQAIPWYQAHFTHYLVAASFTLFTAVNVYLFWPEKPADQLSGYSPAPDKTYVFDSLTYVIEKNNTRHTLAIDSLTAYYQQQLHTQSHVSDKETNRADENGRWYAGRSSEMPAEVYETLKSRGLIQEENGQVYITSEPAPSAQRFTFQHRNPVIADVYEEPDAEVSAFTWHSPEKKVATKKRVSNQVSSKTLKLIEKHYSRGIGIALAPHAEVAGSMFSQGDGTVQPRLGVTADWILSPSLSVETGATYSNVANTFNKESLMPIMPGINYGLGDLENVRITNKLVSAPVALKYRQWISEKNQAIIKGGYTPYFSLEENREYSYDIDFAGGGYPGGGPHGGAPDRRRITEVEKSTGIAYYGGTWTVAAGINHQLKKRHSIEASAFYEKSLGIVGQQNLTLSMAGLKVAYWFGLR